MIYALQGRDGTPIKIGYSATATGARGRMTTMQTGYPYTLHMLMCVDGGPAVERQSHDCLHAFRLRGEWFEAAPTVLEFIHHSRWKGINGALQFLAETPAIQAKVENDASLWIAEHRVAVCLGIKTDVLPAARLEGKAPPFVEIEIAGGRKWRHYRLSDVRTWLSANGVKMMPRWRLIEAYTRSKPPIPGRPLAARSL